MKNVDKLIIQELENIHKQDEAFWDFINHYTKYASHGYHNYPALMMPQLARELIKLITKHQEGISVVFDPFTGSGTTLVEGLLNGLNVIGNDLNPLARLVSKVKTNPIQPDKLRHHYELFIQHLDKDIEVYQNGHLHIEKPTFKNIDYWFKPYVIKELQLIKNNIYKIDDNDIRLFIWVVFSETVRKVSNVRKSEFKMHRLAPEKLEKWNPKVFEIFKSTLHRNLEKNEEFYNTYHQIDKLRTSKIYNMNVMNLSEIEDSSIDLLVTSPPYGDSRTTVGYGQFSRLSLQWLDLDDIEETNKEVHKIDSILLGGKIDKELENHLDSPTLSEALKEIKAKDEKRAKEVLQFYVDLDKCLAEISRVMKPNSYQCWVVGNRTVKLVNLKTDKIIIELLKKYHIKHIASFDRKIINKRIPTVNSPSNKVGEKVSTMNNEIVFIMRKEP